MSKLHDLYAKITDNIPLVKDVDAKEWTITNSLSYIAYKYKEKFGQDFVFKYDAVPSKSIDYKMTSRIWLMLGAKIGDGQIVKDYIDWFYGIYKSKRRFTSINALAKPSLISDFKEYRSKPITISGTKELDKRFIEILQKLDESSYIKTYKDLYFFMESLKSDDNLSSKFLIIKRDMIKNGFNFDFLNNIN
jgi:hypothetical protein